MQISKVGDAVAHVESVCKLQKVDFLKSTYNQTKIRELSTSPQFKELLAAVLVKISILSGIKGEIDDFIKQDISKMILSSFKELSIEEVSKAFELERYGQYDVKTDHFQLFDSNYISQILNKYKKWKIREKTELNLVAPENEVLFTENDILQIRENLTLSVYEEIVKTGFSCDAYHFFADLDAKGKIDMANNARRDLYKRKLREYEVEEKAFIRDKYKAILSSRYLNELAAKITGKTPIESVANKCRSILVSNYLYAFRNYESFKNELK
jgi:hypothetical protein